MSILLSIIQVIFQSAPEIAAAFHAWKDGASDPSNPIHAEVESMMKRGMSDLEDAK